MINEKDIPQNLMAQMRHQFENDPRIRNMQIQKDLLMRKHKYVEALDMGKQIEYLFSKVVQAYLEEAEKECSQIQLKDIGMPKEDEEKVCILNVTMFMAFDIIESCIMDINDTIRKTDKTLSYDMHNDIKELSEMIKGKLEYLSKNTKYMGDLIWADKCDDMYLMLQNKAKSIIKKRKQKNWGKNMEKYQ